MTTAAEARTDPKKRMQRREQAKRRTALLMAEANKNFKDLIERLGNQCVECGATWEDAALSVEHVEGATWERRKVRFDARVRRYWDEHYAGVALTVLCIPCNSAGHAKWRGGKRRY